MIAHAMHCQRLPIRLATAGSAHAAAGSGPIDAGNGETEMEWESATLRSKGKAPRAGSFRIYTQQAGTACIGAVRGPGGVAEKHCHADF
ncbi:hypothetical protein [Jiella sp. M17.18]|uniref:hypothetical protein n=1 Tax=Jiella sp. M17.18 TaxID=3234247 RepID=UPI0034DE2994